MSSHSRPEPTPGNHPAHEYQDHRIGFLDLPAEMRNHVFNNRVLFRTKDGERKELSVAEFGLRHQMLMPLMLVNAQIKNETVPMLLGDNLLHLIGSPFVYHPRQQSHDKRVMLDYSTLDRKCTSVHNPDDHIWGAKMELPPRKFRPLFKHVKITLHAPPKAGSSEILYCRKAPVVARIWANEELDWLYPIRELKDLGFGSLQSLEVEILQPNYYYAGMDGPAEFKKWTEDAIEGMHLDVEEMIIKFENIY